MLENLTVNTELPEDGTNEHRNTLEYLLHSVTCFMRCDALSIGLMKTNK